MIHSLSLKFFRTHEDKSFTFGPGLNCLRGRNEIGKSSVIESMLYALYGSKALRNSLSDTVTWGHKESELKVALTLEVSGRLYSFTRGKSGAECNYDGGTVTGQNEVSNFAAELLGADVNTANKLMLANQNNLRGALEDGPKAMSQQIETLADFDLFDRIFAAAEHKLLTGSTALMDDRVKSAMALVEESKVQPLDLKALDESSAVTTCALKSFQLEADALAPLKVTADQAFQAATAQAAVRQAMFVNVTEAEATAQEHKVQKATADANAAQKVEAGAIDAVKLSITAAETHGTRRAVYVEMTKLMKGYPEAYWEGSKEDFEEAFVDEEKLRDGYQNEVSSRKSRIMAIDHDIALVKAKIITATTCQTCGSELKDKARILDSNQLHLNMISKLEDERLTCYATLAGMETALHNKIVDLGDLKKVRTAAQPYERFASTHGQHVEVSLDTYPPQFKWRGDVPEETNANINELRERLVSLQNQEGIAERGAARSLALAETLKEDEATIKRLRAQLAECPDGGDIATIQQAAWDISNRLFYLGHDLDAARKTLSDISIRRAEVERAYETDVARAAAAAQKLEEAQADLDRLIFNNGLLKKIRAARPLISDKLWAIVLSSVSSMFSTMRGEVSIVTKSKDGFAVNGESVTSLSGSTLDILGKSIRIALIKTFLPNASFMILDEPFASFDEDRTATALGFIAQSGFKQVLLVTHEDVSSAIADHVINL